MDEKIVEHIKGELAKGLSEEQIKESMRHQGWEDEDIERYIRRAKAGTL